MNLTIKQGDTRHAVKATLKDVSGNPIDLSGASIRFIMGSRYGETMVDRAAVQQDGKVLLAFEAGETDTIGLMEAEFRVTYPDGRIETFPNDGYLEINILKNKGGTA